MEASGKDMGYQKLQGSIDKVIEKIGLERTIGLLNSFIQNTQVPAKDEHWQKMVAEYLVSVAIGVFELREKYFLISSITEYRDARMTCYHLLKKYTHSTCSNIGLHFGKGFREVNRYYHVVEDRLEIPTAYNRFIGKYRLVESKLIEFLAKIN